MSIGMSEYLLGPRVAALRLDDSYDAENRPPCTFPLNIVATGWKVYFSPYPTLSLILAITVHSNLQKMSSYPSLVYLHHCIYYALSHLGEYRWQWWQY